MGPETQEWLDPDVILLIEESLHIPFTKLDKAVSEPTHQAPERVRSVESGHVLNFSLGRLFWKPVLVFRTMLAPPGMMPAS